MSDLGLFRDAVVHQANMNGGAGVAYTIVKDSTTALGSRLVATAGATDVPFGVLTDGFAQNRVASVATSGLGMVKVNGGTVNIAVGDWIKSTSSGVGVKAAHNDLAIGRALAPSTADGDIIPVELIAGARATVPGTSATNATNSITLGSGNAVFYQEFYNLTCSYNGAVALSLLAAASVRAGFRLRVTRTVSASAITLTPTAGTIAGAGTHAALDAVNDFAEFVSDGVSNWYIDNSVIA